MQAPTKQELETKTIGELRKKYPHFKGVFFPLREEDNKKIGKKYLSEFGTKGGEFIIESGLFASKSNKEASCKMDIRCCPDCKKTNKSGAEFYKKGRSGIIYCKPCWRIRCQGYDKRRRDGKEKHEEVKELQREVEKLTK